MIKSYWTNLTFFNSWKASENIVFSDTLWDFQGTMVPVHWNNFAIENRRLPYQCHKQFTRALIETQPLTNIKPLLKMKMLLSSFITKTAGSNHHLHPTVLWSRFTHAVLKIHNQLEKVNIYVNEVKKKKNNVYKLLCGINLTVGEDSGRF